LTKSSTPQPSAATQPAPKPAPKQSWGFLVFIFRLLLLGVGGSLAVLAGIAIAQFQPAPHTQDPPLVEKVARGTRSLWSELQRIPQTLGLTPPSPSRSPSAGASPSVTAATPPPSEIDQQKLQAQLTQLQGELEKLKSQPALSEGDRAKQAAGVQEQIRIIQQQLNSAAAPGVDAPIVPPTTSKVSGNDTLLVTLPTDSLFAPGQTSLKSNAETILDSILIDLQRYPGATIRISAHSDLSASQAAQGSAQSPEGSDRARTFEQATAIEQYLAGKLGDSYHWTVAGYGHSQPLVDNSSDVNRQRNRRIEIAIDP
jgi:outer membrane protein OmpA-like peptidoglycan-associated protein